jgi:rhodanese-related sulfurtransferase
LKSTHNPIVRAQRSWLADLLFLVALAAFLGCVHHALRADRPLFTAPRNPGYAALLTVSAVEIRSGLGQSGTVLVDARPEENFRQGTIPTSVSLPLHAKIEDRVLQTLLAADRVIAFCSNIHCNASKELGVILKSRGVDRVYVFPGGMDEWRQAGYPVATTGKD